MIKTPVLLIVYNRPKLVAAQLELLLADPHVSQIYVAGDGPKSTPEDKAKVATVRDIVKEQATGSKISIQTHFASKNQGCQRGVESALNWFFDHVEQGIILEDDCRPDPSFFEYCGQLLVKYQADSRIGMIAGTKPVTQLPVSDSYFFSRHSMVWGWATWKSAWQDYQIAKKNGLDWIQEPPIRQALLTQITPTQLGVIEKVLNGEIDTWDYIWYLTNLLQSRYCILPQHNLVSNLGFAPDATHTKLKTTQSRLPVKKLKFPLRHPEIVIAHEVFDQAYLQQQQKWRVLISVFQAYWREWAQKSRV